mgnify:CR=1 FL=1
MKNIAYNGVNYILLSKSELNKFSGYDKVIAECHLSNCGYIICYEGGYDSDFEPLDDEYILDALYNLLEN